LGGGARDRLLAFGWKERGRRKVSEGGRKTHGVRKDKMGSRGFRGGVEMPKRGKKGTRSVP